MGLFDYQQYVIDQKLLSIRQTYLIKDPAGNEIGKIEKKLISIGPKYSFTDSTGAEVGKIEGKVISVRPTYNILDPAGAPIATIKKKLFSFLGGEYWFENPAGQEIMRAKGNFLAYEYHIRDNAGNELASVSKKILSIRDSYSINITSPTANRYLVLAAVTCIDACEHPRR
jgi:uncharacterized protein YxjI